MAKNRGKNQPKTGNDFINQARELGAYVENAGTKRGQHFTKITTPQGSMYITPGNQPLDPRTRKNYKHWFRLLGLLSAIVLCGGYALLEIVYALGIWTPSF